MAIVMRLQELKNIIKQYLYFRTSNIQVCTSNGISVKKFSISSIYILNKDCSPCENKRYSRTSLQCVCVNVLFDVQIALFDWSSCVSEYRHDIIVALTVNNLVFVLSHV